MSKEYSSVENRIRSQRKKYGWSQHKLAERAGLSRTGVGAIESGRLIPSTAAALALAAAFGCRVEELFSLTVQDSSSWAWPPVQDSCRYWRALIGSRKLLYPVEPSPLGTLPHDGVWRDQQFRDQAFADPVRTLVLACCDPAVGLLASEYARQTPFRLLVLSRSSRASLELLAQGLVHAAGLHLGSAENPHGNAQLGSELLGQKFHLLRITDWEEGVALSPELGNQKIESLLRGNFRWIGREAGSGARRLLDRLTGGQIIPEHLARDHRGVAQSIRCGFAQVGVSVRLVCEEEGIDFLSVHREAYDLCIPHSNLEDPRIKALISVVKSVPYRKMLSELPGYDGRMTGELQSEHKEEFLCASQ